MDAFFWGVLWVSSVVIPTETKRQKKIDDQVSSSFNLSDLYYIFFTLLSVVYLFDYCSYTYPYRFTPSLVRLVFWWSFHLLNVYYNYVYFSRTITS